MLHQTFPEILGPALRPQTCACRCEARARVRRRAAALRRLGRLDSKELGRALRTSRRPSLLRRLAALLG